MAGLVKRIFTMQLKAKQHHLIQEVNGQEQLFFYTADTAWELFHKLTWEEACKFIDNRADKGFNVIQAVAVAELDGLHTPTYEGNLLPFVDPSAKQLVPCDAYFEHVIKVIRYANSKGIIIALVPMWGAYLIPNIEWGGTVKPIFSDSAKAAAFVEYLASKCAESQVDIIWMLGGDRSYITEEHRNCIKAMAQAIRNTESRFTGVSHLITVHTQGGRSVYDMLQQPDYIDFITWQSGHMGSCYPSWRAIENDYRRTPLPVLDAEPCYESHPVMNEYTFSISHLGSRFTADEVRRSCYWSVFSGGAGITYGCYGIWQMRREEDDKNAIPESAASAYKGDQIPYWHQSLNFPGAFQIPYIRSFIENLPHNMDIVPDNNLILSDNPSGSGHMAALTNKQHEFIAVYIPYFDPNSASFSAPNSRMVSVDISCFGYEGFSVYWFDPRYNIYTLLTTANSESQFFTITPPDHHDYVLLIKKKGSN